MPLLDQIDTDTGSICKNKLWDHLLTHLFAQNMTNWENSEATLLTQMEDMA
jgi:hypothetical protein